MATECTTVLPANTMPYLETKMIHNQIFHRLMAFWWPYSGCNPQGAILKVLQNHDKNEQLLSSGELRTVPIEQAKI